MKITFCMVPPPAGQRVIPQFHFRHPLSTGTDKLFCHACNALSLCLRQPPCQPCRGVSPAAATPALPGCISDSHYNGSAKRSLRSRLIGFPECILQQFVGSAGSGETGGAHTGTAGLQLRSPAFRKPDPKQMPTGNHTSPSGFDTVCMTGFSALTFSFSQQENTTGNHPVRCGSPEVVWHLSRFLFPIPGRLLRCPAPVITTGYQEQF